MDEPRARPRNVDLFSLRFYFGGKNLFLQSGNINKVLIKWPKIEKKTKQAQIDTEETFPSRKRWGCNNKHPRRIPMPLNLLPYQINKSFLMFLDQNVARHPALLEKRKKKIFFLFRLLNLIKMNKSHASELSIPAARQRGWMRRAPLFLFLLFGIFIWYFYDDDYDFFFSLSFSVRSIKRK